MKWLSSRRRESSESEPPSAAAAEPGDVPSGSTLGSSLDDPPPASIAASVSSSAAPLAPPSLPGSDGTLASESSPAVGAANDVAPANAAPPESVSSAVTGPAIENPFADVFARFREELLQRHQSLSDDQRNLNDLFATRLRSDEAQGRAVEKLHDELRQYKANFIRQQLLPLLKEVIFCHDFVVGQLGRLAPSADGESQRAPLDATRQMLIDLLFKYDVEPFRTEEERFDPKTQQCTQTVPALRSEADKTVAARGLPGFRGPEGIVRREHVSVYKFTPGAD